MVPHPINDVCADIKQPSVGLGMSMKQRWFSDSAVLDKPSDLGICRREASVMSDGKLGAMLFARCNHVICFAQGCCHRFFAQNTFDARVCRSDGYLSAHVLPCRDAHDVQILFFKHFVVVGIHCGDGKFFGESFR